MATVEEGEEYPGGDTTNTFLGGNNAFILPAENILVENEMHFYSGNSFFNQPWVEHPASTESRDGLGPLYNARSCAACHFKDGRAKPPDVGEKFLGLVLQIGVEEGEDYLPLDGYGSQLQDFSVQGVPVEGVPTVQYEESTHVFNDGSPYTLIKPYYDIEQTNYGTIPEEVVISPRIAPAMIGLGLLEAIDTKDIEYYADPQDHDGDGISGQIRWVTLPESTQPTEAMIGRFGWKASKASVAHQVGAAYLHDMGITNPLFPLNNCDIEQSECLDAPQEETIEIRQELFDKVVLYSSLLAVPMRREWTDKEVLHGKRLFHNIGCDSCHIPNFTTSCNTALPEVACQNIWPYTDLLLHDMGEGLADQESHSHTLRREWRTPPLWGIGFIEIVNGHTRFLHDGRARSLEEAILWHGGEGNVSKQQYIDLDEQDRSRIVAFLESL